MEEISTVGIDIAKSVFQVHAINVGGNMVVRRQLRRQQMLNFFAQVPPCLVGIEACGTAHYWARELSILHSSCSDPKKSHAPVGTDAMTERGYIAVNCPFSTSTLRQSTP